MKGRLGRTIWSVVAVNAVALIVVLGLAYGAGARSGGLSLLDFGALPQTAGFEFLGAAFVIVAVTLWMVFLLGGRVVKPATQLADYTDAVLAADPDARLELDSDDDFAVIADGCKRLAEIMQGAGAARTTAESLQIEAADFAAALAPALRGDLTIRLQTGETGLQEISTSVNSLLDTLTARVQRLRLQLTEMTSGVERAATFSATSQAALRSQESSVTEAADAAAALATSLRDSGKTSRNAVQVASHALELADHGTRVVAESAEGIERIREAMQDTAARIKALGDRSLQIYEIINIIQETNLLALNAAIEASQAGDSGRAIQVLRTELNKLSEHSRNSVREIVNLLRNIQAESNEVLAMVEQASRAADVGARLSEQCGKAFSTIAATLHQSSDLAEGMGEAVRRQAEDADRMGLLVRSVAADGRHGLEAAAEVAALLEQVHTTGQVIGDILAQMRIAAPGGKPRLETPAAKSATAAHV